MGVACSGQKLALVGRNPRDRGKQNRSRQKCRLTQLDSRYPSWEFSRMSSVSKNPPRHKTVHNIWRDGWQELRIRNIATMLGRRARDWQEPWTQPSSPG